MGHHAVVRADGQALEVPAADHGFPGVGFGEAAVGADGLGGAGQLRHGGDVVDPDAPGRQDGGDGVEAFPGRQHVQHHAVHGAGFLGLDDLFLEVAQGDLPGRVRAAEDGFDVAAGDVGELLAPLKGVQVAVVAHRAEQRDGQGTGADAGLDDAGAGEDIGHGDDLGGVLGVDDRRATRHGEDEVRKQRPEGLVLLADVVDHHRAVRLANDLVVVEEAAVGVERAAGLQADRVHPAAFVRQLHPLAHPERAAAAVGTGRGQRGDVPVRGGVGGGVAAHGMFLAPVTLGGRGFGGGPWVGRRFTAGR